VLLQGNTLTFGDATSTQLSAVISGAGGLVKQGAGTVSLSGANTFTGGVALNGGTLALLVGTALEDSVVLTLANTAGAVLQLAANERVGIVLGGGTVGGEIQLGTFELTLGNSAGGEFAGVISGLGSLVKVGSVELILSGSNTFTGGAMTQPLRTPISTCYRRVRMA
jgi:autotransporter-associated beta strand protein